MSMKTKAFAFSVKAPADARLPDRPRLRRTARHRRGLCEGAGGGIQPCRDSQGEAALSGVSASRQAILYN